MISVFLQELVELGNLNAERDWGYAEDYVYAMWLMLQQEKPIDLVIASGEKHTVREFATKAFARGGIELVYAIASILCTTLMILSACLFTNRNCRLYTDGRVQASTRLVKTKRQERSGFA